MLIRNNRFAIIPIECTDCQRYIWLESYRHGNKWHRFIDRFIKVNICKECSKKYAYGHDNGIDYDFGDDEVS